MLVSWPLEAAVELGASWRGSWDIIWSLSPKIFPKFASLHTRHRVLQAGSACWVPYGHQVCVVALGITVYEALGPYMAGQLAAFCPMKAGAFGYNTECVQADMEASRQP